MSINGESLATTLGQVTTPTTTEGNFRAGMNNTITQVDTNQVLLQNTSAADLTKLSNVTATAAELNVLDGATVSTSEINVLDGVTATTGEINILDGVTASTAELNIIDGVTATTGEINKLDGFTGTASDLNKIAAVSADAVDLDVLDGASAASLQLADLLKAQLLDAAGNGTNGQVLNTNGQSGNNLAFSWQTPLSNQFVLEDGDGTEVTVAGGKQIKFIEGTGLDINFTDIDPGSSSDPFDLTFSLSTQTPYSVLANTGNSTAAASALALASNEVLGRSGTGNVDGLPIAANEVLGRSGTGSLQGVNIQTAMIANDAVTWDKVENVTAQSVVGRASGSDGSASEIAIGTDRVLGRSGSGNLSGIQVNTNHLANDAVTNAKIANDAVGTAQIANNVTLGGTPNATTLATSTDSVAIATTAFVKNQLVIEPESNGDPSVADFGGAMFVAQYS